MQEQKMDNITIQNNLKDNFTIVANEIINNKDISLKAKGLYVFMMSKPTSWKFSFNGLKYQLKEGEKAIRSAIKELEQFGILIKHPIRKNNNEFAGWKWILHPNENEINDQNGNDQNGNEISNIDKQLLISKNINKKQDKTRKTQDKSNKQGKLKLSSTNQINDIKTYRAFIKYLHTLVTTRKTKVKGYISKDPIYTEKYCLNRCIEINKKYTLKQIATAYDKYLENGDKYSLTFGKWLDDCEIYLNEKQKNKNLHSNINVFSKYSF